MFNREYLIRPEHESLVEELLAKFSREELLGLAERLPFDRSAARVLLKHFGNAHLLNNYTQPFLLKWIELGAAADIRAACYIAAASEHVISKILEEMMRLSQEKLRLVNEANALLQLASEKDSQHLLAAMKGNATKDDVEKVKE